MATPSIALRFRDATPGVDTIAEHKEILGRDGAVWWGWWKKNFEEGYLDYFRGIPTGGNLNVFIVDREKERFFHAVCTQWCVGSSDSVEPERVPRYYRSRIHYVFGWFLLTRLDEIPYDEKIAQRFQDKTVLLLDAPELSGGEPIPVATKEVKGSCLLHLSDLHFGKDYNFLPDGEKAEIGEQRKLLTECLCADLARIGAEKDIGAVIVTGDFTTVGDWSDKTKKQILSEFAALAAALGIDKTQILAVPGNHDIVRYSPDVHIDAAEMATSNQTNYEHEVKYRTFAEELVGRHWKEPLNYVRRLSFPTTDVLFCILNSCTIVATEWTEYGYVGSGGIEVINQLRKEEIARPTFKFLALHHHLLPVVGVQAPISKGVTMSLDASELLDAAQMAGVHVALHGHQHKPRLVKYQTVTLPDSKNSQPLLVVSNGSTGVTERRRPGSERNSYCLFKFDADSVTLSMRELRNDGNTGQTVFEGVLGVSAARRAES